MEMRARICVWSTLLFFSSSTITALAQTQSKKAVSPAILELRMEVATKNDDRSPQAIRFTLKNRGNRAIDSPLPPMDCGREDGRIYLSSKIVAGEPGSSGFGHGCGGSGGPGVRTIVERIRNSWLHLKPGEFLVFTGEGRSMLNKANGLLTYEIWAEYEPPRLTEGEKKQAEAAGYLIPTSR
jgi:hypothetical protein